ncbi:hypothetical protein PybrP1_004222 [[Pythium] brassicae (nom. inval.)]|nr:hypothetical protein PybrP1_004222 [[Pythium] brassicae (nom. inval.)]
MLAMPLEPAATALSRKRPRVGADTPPQRLLSFASLSAATPRAGVLPTISQLLSQQQQQQQQQQQLSPPPMLTVSSSSTTPATASEDEDDETEDKTPWPSAAQYHDIFRNLRAGDVPVYDLGVDPRGVPLHPEFIYSQPVSCMYFLKCAQLLGKGSFGFPRKKKTVAAATSGVQFVAAASAVDAPGKRLPAKSKKESSKDFEWRKMSFVTGLPKKQPVVRYITATCYSRASDVAAKKKVFRMHAVMLASDAGDSETGEYVLVHIRAGGSKRVGLRATAGDVEVQDAPASPLAARPECVETVSVPRPISPPQVVAPSYDSQAASSSPCNKKLLHADLSSSHHFALNQPIGAGLGKFQLSRSPPQMRALSPSHFGGLQQQQQRQPLPSPPAMARHPTFDSGKLASARQAMRDMILQSCNSRDEMAEYVHCLQEELAALQQQTARS